MKDYKQIYDQVLKSMNEEKEKNKKFDLFDDFDELNAFSILKNMNKNQVINYHSVLEKLIKKWEILDKRPSIILHSCCAPCSTYTLEFLCKYADITILFANSNIHPKSEYIKRSLVQQKFIEDFNKATGNNVKFIEDKYDVKHFLNISKGLENEPEGSKRCHSCFQMRLDIVAKYAKELNFDYFGSALTLSPKKNSKIINEIGLEISRIYDVKYLPSDFKKNNGYQRSVQMCKEYDVYRQCYCGCLFALKQQIVQQQKNAKQNI